MFAIVALEEGVRMAARVVGVPPEDVRCEMPVRVVFPAGDGQTPCPASQEADVPTYLEDLAPGAEFRSAGRTVTESDIMAFAGVSGDFNRLHTDEPWVRENTPFRGRIAHGLLVLAMSSGLATPGLDDVEIIAYLEETRRFTGRPTRETRSTAVARERGAPERLTANHGRRHARRRGAQTARRGRPVRPRRVAGRAPAGGQLASWRSVTGAGSGIGAAVARRLARGRRRP